jgi:hypothetical protein
MFALLTVLAVISGLAWIGGFFVYHVASASIHLLLLLAVVCGVLALVVRTRHHRVT